MLAGAGLAARLVGEQVGGSADADAPAQVVAIMSDSYCPGLRTAASRRRAWSSGARSAHRGDGRAFPPGLLDEVPLIELADLSETEAVDRLIDRFEGMRSPEEESVTGTMRYPGDRPRADRQPAHP